MNIVQLLDLSTCPRPFPCTPNSPLLFHPSSSSSSSIPSSSSASSSSTSSIPTTSPPNGRKENHRQINKATNNSTRLKFGIANILEPGFGSCKSLHPSSLSLSPPALPLPNLPLNPSSSPALPSWIFCTRYSDRPSSGSRTRKAKRREQLSEEEKRPRTAFTAEQLERLKAQFVHSRYLTEKKRQELAHELGLNECQIKIWFQNKRAKLKKSAQRAQQATMRSLMGPPGSGGGGGVYKRQ